MSEVSEIADPVTNSLVGVSETADPMIDAMTN